jgi:hypothetical protein
MLLMVSQIRTLFILLIIDLSQIFLTNCEPGSKFTKPFKQNSEIFRNFQLPLHSCFLE